MTVLAQQRPWSSPSKRETHSYAHVCTLGASTQPHRFLVHFALERARLSLQRLHVHSIRAYVSMVPVSLLLPHNNALASGSSQSAVGHIQ